jgi:Apoptosis regulator proteins, Bcl-2 family
MTYFFLNVLVFFSPHSVVDMKYSVAAAFFCNHQTNLLYCCFAGYVLTINLYWGFLGQIRTLSFVPVHEIKNYLMQLVCLFVYCSIVKRLKTSHENIAPTFINVVNEMFVDNQYNWGRVVTVYAFAGWLARYVCCGRESDSMSADVPRESNHPECAAEIAKLAGEFVADRLGGWVRKQGGWVSNVFSLREMLL